MHNIEKEINENECKISGFIDGCEIIRIYKTLDIETNSFNIKIEFSSQFGNDFKIAKELLSCYNEAFKEAENLETIKNNDFENALDKLDNTFLKIRSELLNDKKISNTIFVQSKLVNYMENLLTLLSSKQ